MTLSEWQPSAYKDYRWIVADPQLLGGKLAIRGTRLAVSLILECLASGMSVAEIDESFSNAFPHEALPEVLKVASELADSFHVANPSERHRKEMAELQAQRIRFETLHSRIKETHRKAAATRRRAAATCKRITAIEEAGRAAEMRLRRLRNLEEGETGPD